MTRFTVDPSTLSALSRNLSGIHDRMQAMNGVAGGYQGMLGGSDLERDVESFCTTWGYGIGQLGDHMASVVQRLDAAASGYSTSEGEIGQAAQELGNG